MSAVRACHRPPFPRKACLAHDLLPWEIAALNVKASCAVRNYIMLAISSSAFFPRQSIAPITRTRSEEHTSELQSLMRISYAVFCLKKKKNTDLTKSNCRNKSTQLEHNRFYNIYNRKKSQTHELTP